MYVVCPSNMQKCWFYACVVYSVGSFGVWSASTASVFVQMLVHLMLVLFVHLLVILMLVLVLFLLLFGENIFHHWCLSKKNDFKHALFNLCIKNSAMTCKLFPSFHSNNLGVFLPLQVWFYSWVECDNLYHLIFLSLQFYMLVKWSKKIQSIWL